MKKGEKQMISISLLIEILFAVVIARIMYISITVTDGNYIKNVLLYSILSLIIIFILGLRGVSNFLFMWVIYTIEAIPMVWIMNKLYNYVDTKWFVIISAICWFIVKFILSLFS